MNAIIIDDEPMPAKQLASLIKRKFSEIEHCEIFQSATKAIQRLEEHFFDIVFLDIKMSEMSGFDFLEKVNLPQKTHVIFTTAFEEYAVDAFNADAFHYLVKPVTEDSLAKALLKIHRFSVENLNNQTVKGFFSVYNNNEHHIIKEKDIIRIEAHGSYSKIVTLKKTILSSKNIGWNEQRLNSQYFTRVHKSHIININMIDRISKSNYIVLSNNEIIPLAPSRQKVLAKAMGLQ